MIAEVLFFGATAQVTGQRRIAIEVAPETRANTIFDKLVADHPRLALHKLRFAVNQQFATGNEIICDGDELAMFTAVSGG